MTRSTFPFRRLLGISAVLVISISAVLAHASSPNEYEVEAAYLYNFGLFVQWPAVSKADAAFPICVFGVDPFGKVLDRTLAGQSIGPQSTIPRRISNPQDALGCRIVFVSSSEENNVKQLLSSLGKTAVLTVSDMPQFLDRGGMIQFVVVNNRVHFEVNLAAARRAGVTLSSQLVKLAVTVETSLPPEK
jgi:hypothetical protein